MNTKRFVTLLNKSPYVLFTEVDYDKIPENILLIIPKKFNISAKDTIETKLIMPGADIRGIIKATTKLPDPLAYNIIDALANVFSTAYAFPVPYFTSAIWQEHIDWQNEDTKPESAPVNSFIITVAKFTHELSITGDANTVLKEKVYEGVIHLESLDTKVPFPQALLKECTMEVYDIIVQTSVSRVVGDKTKSKYLSIMQTGHDTFSWVNLAKIEKDLTDIIKEAGITIEE